MMELNEALIEVTDWFHFGAYLGVPYSKLLAIERDYGRDDPTRCKLEMLIFWTQEKTRKWVEIVQALVKMRMRMLAQKIAEDHGEIGNWISK